MAKPDKFTWVEGDVVFVDPKKENATKPRPVYHSGMAGPWTDDDLDHLEAASRMAALERAFLAHKPGGHNHDQRAHGKGSNMPPVGSEGNPYMPDGYGTNDPDKTMEEAADLLGQGHHVRFEQLQQVCILADKINELEKAAKANGTYKKGKYDACNVQVPGTNIFCSENKGIPRVKMPQLKGKPTAESIADKEYPKAPNGEVDLSGAFRKHLEESGVRVIDTDVPIMHLRATQREADLGKISGMYEAQKAGTMPRGAPIFTTRDGYIVDGHHTAMSTMIIDQEDGTLGNARQRVMQIDASIADIIPRANAFALSMGIPPAGVSSAKPGTAAAGPMADLERAWTAGFIVAPCLTC